MRNAYTFLCIILGLAVIAPNLAFSDNDEEEETADELVVDTQNTREQSSPTPSNARSSRCNLSYFNVDVDQHFSLSQEPAARAFQTETGIAFYNVTKTFVYKGESFSYELVKTTREEEAARFTRRAINVLKTYPKEFILKLDKVCFVLIDSFKNNSGTKGLTPGATIILPTNAVNSILNHELMHAVDFSYPFDLDEAAAWNNANGSHKYDKIYSGAPSFSAVRYSDIREAFLTRYANASQAEDKAEIFAAMTHNYNDLLKQLNKLEEVPTSNKTIRKKLELIVNHLKSIDSSLSDSYWSSRAIDQQDGTYEACIRRGTDPSECVRADVSLPQHNSWK